MLVALAILSSLLVTGAALSATSRLRRAQSDLRAAAADLHRVLTTGTDLRARAWTTHRSVDAVRRAVGSDHGHDAVH